MNDPIKIVHKYKNNNGRLQYNIYVFVGDVPSIILKTLKRIQDKTLYDSLIELSVDEYRILENHYGSRWYNKFFNTYHINYSIEYIQKFKKISDELIKKYGQKWFDEHIKEHKLMEKKLLYSYEALIKDEILRKEQKKKKGKLIEEETDVDYTTKKKINMTDIVQQQRQEITNLKRLMGKSNETDDEMYGGDSHELYHKIIKYNNNLYGGVSRGDALPERTPTQDVGVNVNEGEDDPDDIEDIETAIDAMDEEDMEYDDRAEYRKELQKEADTNEDGEIEFEEGIDQDVLLIDEELDAEELEKIYQDTDVVPDKNKIQTTNLIQQALKDDKLFKKIENKAIDFDTSKDDVMYDESLRNVYYKNYITTQYIFKDDTIKTIKHKICSSIKNNPKFEKDATIAPTRQYLWSEYFYEDKLEKIMIGQKWIKKSDILQIDVEPNSNIRVYEELRGNLKILRDNIRRYGSKIKWEDDDYSILYDYDGYYNNNEIYMIDIYNELGKGYNPDQETLKNLIEVYIRVYFRRIKQDDVKYIIDYLNGNIDVESNKAKSIYETINNDLVLENEIMKEVEMTKKTTKYKSLFKDTYVTQSVIHVNLRTINSTKIDLFRMFNAFVVDENYPFIQYQTLDGQKIYKYDERNIEIFSNNRENIDILTKWFENAPYGISFKVRIVEKDIVKFMAINLSDTGRIEYKTQWKEGDMATINDTKITYEYVRTLIEKINNEKNKVKFESPINEEFKYAFINTIQRFELPEKFVINHNDLSEFSRYFFPYVALVIEPRKRQAKVQKQIEKGKFGTYLRYKRVSKYENQARIEQRVLYFMRNYDYNDQTLSIEISKQFNITLERALEEIDRVKNKHPNIKKSRKILKKLENIPKYKPPGIGIDIQGKQRDKYKIRISGARNKEQLDRIVTFYSILIYLYVETYLFKKPERQELKDKLKKLNNIAKRRNKVDDVVNYEKGEKNVKQMAQIDRKRIGFKPEKGQHQWTRACQNSGTDKKRRPQQFTSIEELSKQGFRLNSKTGVYEKKTFIKGRGGKKKEVLIKAVELENVDDEGNVSGSVFYSCNPDENADHMYIGFLLRSNNPYGQCMPCCFKKDPLTSKNKEKQDYFLKCIGKLDKFEKSAAKITGDKLYILQDTNKIQDGRVGFLPKYLEFLFNQMLNKTRKIKHHYLLSSNTGYFFKQGVKQDEQPFLTAISPALELSIEDIKKKVIDRLTKEKSDLIFTALNNGDIKTSFSTIDKYIEFIRSSGNISYEAINHILSLPGTLKQKGINIIVFKKETITIKKTLEKEKIRDDFVIVCQNPEEISNLKNPDRETIILIKENKNYYPIVLVSKEESSEKNFDIIKTFKYENNPDNIINHIYDFYEKSCKESIIGEETRKIIAKELYKLLTKLIKNTNKEDYIPRYQKIDTRNKCKYIILNNSLILPVRPSGSIYDLSIIKNIDNKLMSFSQTFDKLNILYDISKKEIPIQPIGIYYDHKTKDTITAIGIMTQLHESVPIKPETIKIDEINKMNLIIEYKQMFDRVDAEIAKDRDIATQKIDDRINATTYNNYYNEAYELFRLHLSEYLSKSETENIKKKIIKVVNDIDLDKKLKRDYIKTLLFKIIDKNLKILYDQTKQLQDGGKVGKLIHVLNKLPDLTNYEVNNNREICTDVKSKEDCNKNKHCYWSYDECNFALTRDLIVTFVNKVTEELINNDHKTWEILNQENYFVSDIANYNKFDEKPGQKIIKSNNVTINKILSELFGKENTPIIGKRRTIKSNVEDLYELNIQNPLHNMGEYYIQQIINENISIFRAFANAYTWIKHIFYDIESRNLGFYGNLQTDMANYFRGNVIDWLIDKNNYNLVIKDLDEYIDTNKKKFIMEFINRISKDIITNTNGIVEYYILNKIYNIPIIIYDKYNTILYIIDNGIVYDKFKNKNNINKDAKYNKYKDQNNLKNYINIKYSTISLNNFPISIDVIYYK